MIVEREQSFWIHSAANPQNERNLEPEHHRKQYKWWMMMMMTAMVMPASWIRTSPQQTHHHWHQDRHTHRQTQRDAVSEEEEEERGAALPPPPLPVHLCCCCCFSCSLSGLSDLSRILRWDSSAESTASCEGLWQPESSGQANPTTVDMGGDILLGCDCAEHPAATGLRSATIYDNPCVRGDQSGPCVRVML